MPVHCGLSEFLLAFLKKQNDRTKSTKFGPVPTRNAICGIAFVICRSITQELRDQILSSEFVISRCFSQKKKKKIDCLSPFHALGFGRATGATDRANSADDAVRVTAAPSCGAADRIKVALWEPKELLATAAFPDRLIRLAVGWSSRASSKAIGFCTAASCGRRAGGSRDFDTAESPAGPGCLPELPS
jgi:hypothetical protein